MEKFYENKILSLIAYLAKNTKHCGKTKVAKLLFYVDWQHLKHTGKTITGLNYNAYNFGPFPKSLYSSLNDKKSYLGSKIDFIDAEKIDKPIHVKFQYDPKYFSKFELGIIEKAVLIFQKALGKDMVKASHWKDEPWTKVKERAGLYAPINEELAFEYKDAQITLKEYQERKKEREELSRLNHA